MTRNHQKKSTGIKKNRYKTPHTMVYAVFDNAPPFSRKNEVFGQNWPFWRGKGVFDPKNRKFLKISKMTRNRQEKVDRHKKKRNKMPYPMV